MLAVLVVLGTVAALTMPASTMSVADMATPETAAADAENGQAADAENGQAADAPAQDPNATAPAENTPAATAPAATPAPATPESAAPAEAEYTAALGEGADALNVVVTAPAGAFDEGVEPVLQVTALESEQDLQAIAAELDGHEVAYDGFAALDITFTDAQGQEIEPKLPVKVRMELPQAVVDSGIDLTTLTVQHLAEDDQGNVTSVDQVASVAGNTITLSDAAAAAVNEAAGIATMSINALTAESAEAPVVAEFEVDGFSSFVITWDKYFEITVHYVNESGEDINGTSKKVTIKKDESIYFADLAETTVNGLEYKRAAYSEDKRYDDSDKTVTHITADSGTIFGSGARWVEFYNETETVKTIYQGNFGGWGTGTQKADVYLVYGEPDQGGDNPGGGDSGSTEANVTVGKSAVLNEDTGNYTLELSVTGDRGSTTAESQVDVLFIIDRSASMQYSIYGGTTRMAAVKDAVSTLVDSINNTDDSIDVRYRAIRFSDADGTRTVGDGWYTENQAYRFKEQVNNISTSGGTNWEAGIHEGIDVLKNSGRPNATQIVVFLSDGVPTYSGGFGREDEHGDGSDHENTEWPYEGQDEDTISGFADDAAEEIQNLDCDYFFAIGIGSDFSGTQSRGRKYMNRLADHVKDGIPTRVLSANSEDDLKSAFDAIEEVTRFFAANTVEMVDPLSDYADLVAVADGTNKGKYEITLGLEKRESTDAEYTPIENAEQTVYVSKDDTSGETVTLTDGVESVPLTVKIETNDAGKETIRVTFAQDYKLAQNYRYTVKVTITPSQKAKDDGMEGNSEAQQTPDENTGTHWANKDEAGNPEKGFWSNDNENAKVTYKAITTDENGNETSSTEGFAMFPKPVIQVQEETTANLTIVKNIYGLSQEQVVDLVEPDGNENGLRFDVDFFNNEDDAKKDNHGNEDGIEGDWTFSVSDTIDYDDGTGSWKENIDISDRDIWPGNDPEEEMSHYVGPVLTEMQDSTTRETYYQYSITIEGVKLEDWYHVWELNTGVTGYDLVASVKAEDENGAEIANIATDTHGNKATAFQLTGNTTVTFTNRYTHSPVTVNFKKVDATYHAQGLAGAGFKLFYIENGENKYYSNANDWTATEGDAEVFTSVDGGTLTLPELEVGRTYFLTEVTAPDGYQLLTDNIQFEVKANGDIDNVKYVGGGALKTEGGDQGSTDTTTPPTYLIPNSTGVELPETGGRGTNFLTIGGLLMMAAAAGGYVLRRRRGKEAR
ncbi:MAG: SpaA isopeptide-forming pilin-related protein [Gemmiger sp.]